MEVFFVWRILLYCQLFSLFLPFGFYVLIFCYFYLLGLLSLLSRLSFNISFIACYFLYWTSMFFKFICVFRTLLILSLNLIDFCPSGNVLIHYSFLSFFSSTIIHYPFYFSSFQARLLRFFTKTTCNRRKKQEKGSIILFSTWTIGFMVQT